LTALGICLAGSSGCGREETRDELFLKARPHLEACQRLVELNGGKEPDGEQWKQSRTELLHLKPKIIPTLRGEVVLFEILNNPLDCYEYFVYVPQGSQVDDYLKQKAWLQVKTLTKKLADNWYLVIH
jgi:hypothetical protein